MRRRDELIELCKVAAKYQGKYISHMRSEGNRLLEALDELIRISREAKIPAEIYHIKAAGETELAEARRVSGADRSRAKRRPQNHAPTCTPTPRAAPGSTPACRHGRKTAVIPRCSSACAIRRRARKSRREVKTPSDEWENLYLAAGSPDKILLVGFQIGKTEAAHRQSRSRKWRRCAAKIRSRRSWICIAEDESRIDSIYFLMSEENVKKEMAKPWISFGPTKRRRRRKAFF